MTQAATIPAPAFTISPGALRLPYLLLAVVVLELLALAMMLPAIQHTIDKAMAASPLLRPEMKGFIVACVFVMTPVLRLLTLTVLSLLMVSAGRLSGAVSFHTAVRVMGLSALVLAAGKASNVAWTVLQGQSNFKHDHFALGTWVAGLVESAPVVARLNLWDGLALITIAISLRRLAGASTVRAMAMSIAIGLLPLLMFYRLQQIMGN